MATEQQSLTTATSLAIKKNSNYNLFDSYKVISVNTEQLSGASSLQFSNTLAIIISESMERNNMNILSREQKDTMDRFYAQSDAGLEDNDLKQLDQYLGTYYG